MPVEPDVLRNLRTFLVGLGEHFPSHEKTVLYMGGGAAILLAYEGQVRTDDVDLIGERTGLLKQLSEEAGKGSELHRETDYYLDIVPPGLFPQEWGWRSRTRSLEFGTRARRARILELHDLILSKLKRFAARTERIFEACANERNSTSRLFGRGTHGPASIRLRRARDLGCPFPVHRIGVPGFRTHGLRLTWIAGAERFLSRAEVCDNFRS
jgi:hypothetical protein